MPQEMPPLASGANLSSLDIQNLVSSGVKQALEEVRAERKLGRSDQGRGSEAVGSIVRKYREKNGQTQKRLASAAGVHPTTIGKIENGERGMSLQTFAKLSQFMEQQFTWDIVDEVASWS